MTNDPHSPRFHFVPGGWMNDLVPFFWDGAYPERLDCLHIALFAKGGTALVKSVDVWEMKP